MGIFRRMLRKREDEIWRAVESAHPFVQRVSWLHAWRLVKVGDHPGPEPGQLLLSDQALHWQPKFRGRLKIDLSCIEEVIWQPGAEGLAVQARKDSDDEPSVFVWVIQIPGQRITAEPLRAQFVKDLRRHVELHRPPQLPLGT
jgi:hypothetical protein